VNKLTLQATTIDRRDCAEDGDEFIQKYVLVEGDQQSLHFLGAVLIAFANGELGDTFDLHPRGAGSAHLSEASDIGIYLRKLEIP